MFTNPVIYVHTRLPRENKLPLDFVRETNIKVLPFQSGRNYVSPTLFQQKLFFFFLSNFLKRASTYLNQQCGKKLLTVYLHHFFFSRERTQKGKSGKKKNQKNYLTTDLSLIKNIGFCFCRRQKKQQLEKQQGEQSYQEGQAVQILIFILVYQ